MLVNCRGAKYQNLWFDKNRRARLIENNIEFFMHGEAIRHQVKNMCGLEDKTIRRFRQVVRFCQIFII